MCVCGGGGVGLGVGVVWTESVDGDIRVFRPLRMLLALRENFKNAVLESYLI